MANELITVTDGVAILDHDTSLALAGFEKRAKEIKEAQERLRESIRSEMLSKGIKKIETDDLIITFKDAYDRETFKSADFRADHPDIYDHYIKISPVKSSVSISLKEEKNAKH